MKGDFDWPAITNHCRIWVESAFCSVHSTACEANVPWGSRMSYPANGNGRDASSTGRMMSPSQETVPVCHTVLGIGQSCGEGRLMFAFGTRNCIPTLHDRCQQGFVPSGALWRPGRCTADSALSTHQQEGTAAQNCQRTLFTRVTETRKTPYALSKRRDTIFANCSRFYQTGSRHLFLLEENVPSARRVQAKRQTCPVGHGEHSLARFSAILLYLACMERKRGYE